jgi:hypothetical protein
MTLPKIKALHAAIEKSLFRIDGRWDYIAATNAITMMAMLIDSYSGETEDWLYIGESGYTSVDSLIVGAYWHYSNWHNGQGSASYRCLSALGRIFKPGMTSQPQRDDPEWDCYDQLNRMAKRHHGKPIYDFVPIAI